MKKIILFFGITLLHASCGGAGKATSALSDGNYHKAFESAVEKLRKDKNKFSKNVPVLQEAFEKAEAKDIADIKRLENNPTIENLTAIHKKYALMDIRQDEVRMLQPLYYEGKEYSFKFDENIGDKIAKSKTALSKKLYDTSTQLLASSNKEDTRKAHKYLEELLYINPDYKSNTSDLIRQAKEKSSSFVLVQLNNKIYNQLKDSTSLSELKNFTTINASNFNNPWVIYHAKKEPNRQYDFIAQYDLNTLNFVPEKTNQQKVNQEQRVQDGWEYVKDAKGNVMKDENGNDMKKAKYVTVRAEVMLYQQVKSATMDGTFTLKNAKTGAVVGTSPIKGEAKLENVYAKYRGDQRAIEQKYHQALQNQQKQFPADPVFKKYALENFKLQGMSILNQQKL